MFGGGMNDRGEVGDILKLCFDCSNKLVYIICVILWSYVFYKYPNDDVEKDASVS